MGSLSAAWGFKFNVIVLDVVAPTETSGLWGGAVKYVSTWILILILYIMYYIL